MRTDLSRRIEALEKRGRADDLFAHLSDDELDAFCDLLREKADGDPDKAQAEWEALPHELRAKFSHCIVQHEREGAH